MGKDLQRIIDADYEVVGGPYQVGEEHRREKGWYFTGKYDHEGNTYFIRHPRWFWWQEFWRIPRLFAFVTVAFFAGCALLLVGAVAFVLVRDGISGLFR